MTSSGEHIRTETVTQCLQIFMPENIFFRFTPAKRLYSTFEQPRVETAAARCSTLKLKLNIRLK
jgi:hypothetical protein